MANREGQTIQWPTEKDRQYNGQQSRADNTMANREGKTIQWPAEKDRQYNDQQRRTDNTMTNRKKGANNDQQNTTQKTKD
jgi:hypothetical protein